MKSYRVEIYSVSDRGARPEHEYESDEQVSYAKGMTFDAFWLRPELVGVDWLMEDHVRMEVLDVERFVESLVQVTKVRCRRFLWRTSAA